MRDKITLIIASNNESFVASLENYVTTHSEKFHIVATTNSGRNLVELIARLRPDVVISSLFLREIDGISAIRMAKNAYDIKSLKSIILTNFLSTNVSNEAIFARINYILQEPSNISNLFDKVIKCVDTTNYEYEKYIFKSLLTDDQRIENLLISLGFKASIKGFDYLKYAILLCEQDESLLIGVTKNLYPTVAKKFGTTRNCVERAIRHSIDSNWTKNCDKISTKFDIIKDHNVKPTNTAFLTYCVQYNKKRLAYG